MATEPATDVVDAEPVEDFKPPAQDLVALDKDDVFRAMDRADEELILDELQGRALEVMVYSFEQGGTLVTDLSYAGVSEAVRTLNDRGFARMRIAPDPLPQVEEFSQDNNRYVRVRVYAEDEATGAGRWGTATEPQRMKLKPQTAQRRRKMGEQIPEDNTVYDKFAETKALSKASRNALKSLLPVEFTEKLKAQYLKTPDKVKYLERGKGFETAQLPPPLDDDEAKGLLSEIEQLYDKVREHDAGKERLTPGKYQLHLSRNSHSHELLRAYRDSLADFLRILEDEK